MVDTAYYEKQGRSIKDLPYIALFFPYSCYISILLALMIAFLKVYQAVTADPFVFEDVIAVFARAPVFLFSIIGWKIYYKSKLVPLLEVDLDTGRPMIVQGISADGGGVREQYRSEEDEETMRKAQLPP
jgi:amino acid permease